MAERHASEPIGAENNSTHNITIDGHFVQGCTYHRTLNILTLIEITVGGSESISDTGEVISIVGCCRIIALHATMQDGTSEEFGFTFQHN
jgi:hypothetical protein